MAEQKFNIKSGFYNSINQDRLYSAEDMNRPYSRLISEGIFATKEGTPSTDFQVLATDNGMNITVKKGEAMLAKKWIENPTDITITISNNTGIVPRKDSIILQVDKKESGRIANIIYREGIASSNPVPPTLSSEEDIVEMRISNIYVAAGVNKIEQLAITDLRGSSECLWITSLIQQVDTSELFRQWQNAYEDLFNKMKEELKNVEDGSAYLLKTGGTISGDLIVKNTIIGNIETADKLKNSKKIALTGDIVGETSFDGEKDISCNTKINALKVVEYSKDFETTTQIQNEIYLDYPEGCTYQNSVIVSCTYCVDTGIVRRWKYVNSKDFFDEIEMVDSPKKIRLDFDKVNIDAGSRLTIRIVIFKFI